MNTSNENNSPINIEEQKDSEYYKEYRARRKASGNPIPSKTQSSEYRKEYRAKRKAAGNPERTTSPEAQKRYKDKLKANGISRRKETGDMYADRIMRDIERYSGNRFDEDEQSVSPSINTTMPAKTEKQKKFFGAVEGAKHGQKGVSGKAKKVAKEMPEKEVKKFLKVEKEEDEESVSKQLKKKGKATIEGPKVKERKKFAPATKVDEPKKGKGSYKRKDKKETFDENSDIINFIECIMTKKYASANKYLNNAVESRIQRKIEAELETPLFQ